MVAALTLILGASVLNVMPGYCVILPHATSATSFENFRRGKKLKNHETSSQKLGSQSLCSQACNRASFCLSFNFCNNLYCQLNSEDIFSTELGEDLLQDDSSCSYIGMVRHEMPLCMEGDSEVNIQVTRAIKALNNTMVIEPFQ